MMDSLTVIVPPDVIDRNVAEATRLRDEWADRLAMFRAGGRGRLRIGGQAEPWDVAEARLQSIVDHHTHTIELIEAFRPLFPKDDSPDGLGMSAAQQRMHSGSHPVDHRLAGRVDLD